MRQNRKGQGSPARRASRRRSREATESIGRLPEGSERQFVPLGAGLRIVGLVSPVVLKVRVVPDLVLVAPVVEVEADIALGSEDAGDGLLVRVVVAAAVGGEKEVLA